MKVCGVVCLWKCGDEELGRCEKGKYETGLGFTTSYVWLDLSHIQGVGSL